MTYRDAEPRPAPAGLCGQELTADDIRAATLLTRLANACQRFPDWGGDLWSRGVEVIQRKCGVVIYLKTFVPGEMICGETKESEVHIDVTDE